MAITTRMKAILDEIQAAIHEVELAGQGKTRVELRDVRRGRRLDHKIVDSVEKDKINDAKAVLVDEYAKKNKVVVSANVKLTVEERLEQLENENRKLRKEIAGGSPRTDGNPLDMVTNEHLEQLMKANDIRIEGRSSRSKMLSAIKMAGLDPLSAFAIEPESKPEADDPARGLVVNPSADADD